jgi:hypothetical protein
VFSEGLLEVAEVEAEESSNFLDEHEIERIEGLAGAATPGPWFVRQLDDNRFMSMVAVSVIPESGSGDSANALDGEKNVALTLVQDPQYAVISDDLWDENAAFIASARTDVPRLVAEIRRLRSMLNSRLE